MPFSAAASHPFSSARAESFSAAASHPFSSARAESFSAAALHDFSTINPSTGQTGVRRTRTPYRNRRFAILGPVKDQPV